MKKLAVLILVVFALSACKATGETAQTEAPADTSEMELSIDLTDAKAYSDEYTGKITFGDTVSVEGSGVGANGNAVTVAEGGTFLVCGSGKGSVTVEAGEKDEVYLVLSDLSLENPDGPAVTVTRCKNAYIIVKENTENTLSDGTAYDVTADDSTCDGAVFSKCDLTLYGEGKLLVKGNFKHGVVSKDDLVVSVAELSIESVGASLAGKDSVKISNSDINIKAGSDGIRSDNTEDSSRGYVYIEGSWLTVDAVNDGVQAETVLKIKGGNYNITCGGGSENSLASSAESYKGLKAGGDIYIDGGTFAVQSMDDCIHANNDVYIYGGSFSLSSGDDGIHGDNKLDISGGDITVAKSYEGIEATYITVSGGSLNITAYDDGLNAAGGNDGSAMGERPGRGGFSEGTGEIVISGGSIKVDAGGDGVDSNGNITVTGGETYVSGPENSGNGALDFGGSAKITGGVFVALGESGMAQGVTEVENQGAMLVTFYTQRGGVFTVCDESGNEIISFETEKQFSSAVVSSPEIKKGGTYTLKCDGEILATVEMTDDIYGTSGGMQPGGPGGPGGGMKPGRPGGPGGKYF